MNKLETAPPEPANPGIPERSINPGYPFLAWILTVALGPLPAMAGTMFNPETSHFGELIGLWMVFIVFGLVISSPLIVLVYVVFKLMTPEKDGWYVKTAVNVISAIGMYVGLAYFIHFSPLLIFTGYLSALTFSCWIIPVYRSKKAPGSTVTMTGRIK